MEKSCGKMSTGVVACSNCWNKIASKRSPIALSWPSTRIRALCRSICSCWPIESKVLDDLVLFLARDTMCCPNWMEPAEVWGRLYLIPGLWINENIFHIKNLLILYSQALHSMQIATYRKRVFAAVKISCNSCWNWFSLPFSMLIPLPSVSKTCATVVRSNLTKDSDCCNCSIFLRVNSKDCCRRNAKIIFLCRFRWNILKCQKFVSDA